MRIFLISPVRNVDLSTKRLCEAYVLELELEGHLVHWPLRDTPQIDPTGFEICQTNRRAIQCADEVHLIWDENSSGSLFDLGMAFAMKKKIFAIGLPPETKEKSFPNMIRVWSKQCPNTDR